MELKFKSPGVSTREIDLTGPTAIAPQGTPAGVIGTANFGPAFVPVTLATYQDFVATFGDTDGEKFGPLAMNEWFKNARAGTYVRVLGVGDGLKRVAASSINSDGSSVYAGAVKNAGFVVGGKLVNQTTGLLARNPYATNLGVPGRTYFLGAFMSESAGSTFFSSAGLVGPTVTGTQTGAIPVLRGVLMAASGVNLALSSGSNGNIPSTIAGTGDGGSHIGNLNLLSSDQSFTLVLNGHVATSQYPNIVTASMSPASPNYFANVLNTDPTLAQQAGHYLYAHYDVYSQVAEVTGSGYNIRTKTGNVELSAFLLTSSLARNVGSATVPNFEGFADRYRTAFSPRVISQKFGGKNKNLFKFHALDDGASATFDFKISIENIKKSKVDGGYGTFDVVVRDFNDIDGKPVVLESFRGVDLNPGSNSYIARRIGDVHTYYDFDKSVGSQKLVIDGNFPNLSKYIRVEVAAEVSDASVDPATLPVGFRGPYHLVTSGSSIMSTGVTDNGDITVSDWSRRLVQPPIPFRQSLTRGVTPKTTVDSNLYWGVQFDYVDSLTEPNKNSTVDASMVSFAKYFPIYDTANRAVWVGDNEEALDSSGTVLDADRFNNNLFTLERVQVVTSSDGDYVDSAEWAAAIYRRNGSPAASLTKKNGTTQPGRFLSVEKDFGESASQNFYKFTMFMQGGFDGVNIFDAEKTNLSDIAAQREMDDSENQGDISGPTVASFLKAIDVMAEKSDVDIQILAIPGMRTNRITDTALSKVEDRFDAIYLMDIKEYDTFAAQILDTTSQISVNNTVSSFKSRNLNSSFGAAYFPDVVITDPTTLTNVRCPPSVAVLGAFALNDRIAYPWFAPAGFTRGALASVVESQVKLNRANLDTLYDADINPITSFPGTSGVVVFGQKTLQATESALDRVNVRRLLIDLRRRIRTIANSFIFEPNRESTLSRFSAAVNPVLQRVQQQQGVDRFKVIIDTTTTTQADVENNTIRGKIFLQPTRAVEFISLDFAVTNAGTEI